MKDPLFGNKLAGAVLAALLLFFGLPQLAGVFYGGHGGGHGEVHFAYPVEMDFGVSAETAEAAPADLGTLLANASASVGARRAALCKSCHTFEKDGATSTGPNLWNVVGREVASVQGFKYSAALKDFGGTWTFERLDPFIENSQGYVPGTAMVQRFAKADQRAEILAYLRTLSDNPIPLPEPAAVAEPAAGETASDAASGESAGTNHGAPDETADGEETGE